ncbi:MAG: class I SAM-dependent methyltransferase [Pseudaminobacter sp.]|nr:class I SAM-dependent methyltransferase [Pseudaminobacter sp.]
MNGNAQPWHAWYAGKIFSNDWLTARLAPWLMALAPRVADAAEVLEIGSWEGRSAIAFLEILPRATITCVDTFAGSPNHQGDPLMREQLSKLEARFDRNTAGYSRRISKIKCRSVAAMDMLIEAGRQFDVIYIDASHRRDDVFADSVMAWRLLRIGGTLMWDDLRFKLEWARSERPADAIAMFGAMFGECFTEIHRDKQLFVVKTADWPALHVTRKPFRYPKR